MKVFGYARVSSEMQVEGFSISAQERAIRTYCSMQGWELEQLYVDEGRSARSDDISKRPSFAQMLEDAESQKIGAIVVHKLDRFARNIITTLTTLQRLEKSGIGFVSISENMDFTSPIGKAMLAMLAAFSQFYSDNLSAETRKGKAERKKQGLYNGRLPFGTTLNGLGIPTLDTSPWSTHLPTRTPVIPAEGLHVAFEMAAVGATDREIAKALNDRGHHSSGAWGRNPMSKDSVRAIIQNRFYLGELPDDDGGWMPAKHRPMIDRDLFDRAQEQRSIRATNRTGSNAGSRITPFTGLLICGSCGSPMRKQDAYYRCSRNGQNGTCDESGVSMDALEDQIHHLLGSLSIAKEDQQVLEELVHEYIATVADEVPAAIGVADKQRRLKEKFLDGAITIDQYRLQAERIEEMVQAQKSQTLIAEVDIARKSLRYLSNLDNAWLEHNHREKNQLLSTLFTAIYVQNRTITAVLPCPDMAVIVATRFAHRRIGRPSLPPMRTKRGIPADAIPVLNAMNSQKTRYGVSRSRKLTNAQILAIRMRHDDPLRDLADEFGVSHETIRRYRE